MWQEYPQHFKGSLKGRVAMIDTALRLLLEHESKGGQGYYPTVI